MASGSLRAERLSSRVVGIRVKFKKKLYVYDYGINVLNKNVFPQGQVLFWRLNYVGKPIGPLWQWKNPHSKPIVLSTRFLVWFHILTCEKSFVYQIFVQKAQVYHYMKYEHIPDNLTESGFFWFKWNLSSLDNRDITSKKDLISVSEAAARESESSGLFHFYLLISFLCILFFTLPSVAAKRRLAS